MGSLSNRIGFAAGSLLLLVGGPGQAGQAQARQDAVSRYERLEGQLREAADHGLNGRIRSGVALGVGGGILFAAGLTDLASGGPAAVVSPSGVSYLGMGLALLGVAAGTYFATTPEEKLLGEVLDGEAGFSPELRIEATEKRLRAMAQDARTQRRLAGWYGAALAAAGGALYATNGLGNRGVPIAMIAAGSAAAFARWLAPSEAERIWDQHARDRGLDASVSPFAAASGPERTVSAGVALGWRF